VSAQNPDIAPRITPGMVLILLAGLAALCWLSLNEPLEVMPEDCEARGLPSDCWKDLPSPVYDDEGHRVIREGLKR
jgi:hypothetical protein